MEEVLSLVCGLIVLGLNLNVDINIACEEVTVDVGAVVALYGYRTYSASLSVRAVSVCELYQRCGIKI